MSQKNGSARERIRALQQHYRSGNVELAEAFFVPCMNECSQYRRAAGFFSSSALIAWARALPRFVQWEPLRISLLTAPILSDADKAALQRAADPEERTRLLQGYADRIVLDALDFAASPTDPARRTRLLEWMVATERLEIRFAFASHVDDAGIFHSKIGIFDFPWGDRVAFTGSANESEFGHARNYETIDVFRSWAPEDARRVSDKVDEFTEAWNGHASGLEVRPLSPEALEEVRRRAPGARPETESETKPTPPRWRHQDLALEAFLSARRGVLEMATGTGKTRTALNILRALFKSGEIRSAIVAADGNDLLDQWYRELLESAPTLHPRLAVSRHYGPHHERDNYVLNPTDSIFLCSRLALPAALRGITAQAAAKTLLVHDEVHRLGSPGNRESLLGLSDAFQYRLGLSATPEREYDDTGTQFIEDHIGPVIFLFGLEDAIRRGILSPFNYFPLDYEPSDEDRQAIRQVYRQEAARRQAGDPMSPEELWIALSRVHKTSQAKLPVFRDFISDHQHLLERCIVFVETRDYGQQVLEIIHAFRHDFRTYYAAEDSDTLRRFANGSIECILTCHRLSEGIDIQSLTNVILFSSARARLETIQRIGRCLRSDPTNPTKVSNVVDFVRTRDDDADPEIDNADDLRRDWLQELSKIRPEE